MSWRAHKYQRPAWTRDYLRVPYERHGRGPGFGHVGYDCHGFLRLVYHERAGIDVPPLAAGEDAAPGFADAHAIIERQSPTWREIAAATPPAPPIEPAAAFALCRPLDLLLLDPVVDAMHCGVYVGGHEFIHMMTGVGVHVSDLRNGYWRGHLLGIYRAQDAA